MIIAVNFLLKKFIDKDIYLLQGITYTNLLKYFILAIIIFISHKLFINWYLCHFRDAGLYFYIYFLCFSNLTAFVSVRYTDTWCFRVFKPIYCADPFIDNELINNFGNDNNNPANIPKAIQVHVINFSFQDLADKVVDYRTCDFRNKSERFKNSTIYQRNFKGYRTHPTMRNMNNIQKNRFFDELGVIHREINRFPLNNVHALASIDLVMRMTKFSLNSPNGKYPMSRVTLGNIGVKLRGEMNPSMSEPLKQVLAFHKAQNSLPEKAETRCIDVINKSVNAALQNGENSPINEMSPRGNNWMDEVD